MLAWYVERGWLADRAHRRVELARSELGAFGDLEDSLIATRIAYETWLDDLLDRFVCSVTDQGLDTDGLDSARARSTTALSPQVRDVPPTSGSMHSATNWAWNSPTP